MRKFLILFFFLLSARATHGLDLFYSAGPSIAYVKSEYQNMPAVTFDLAFISDSEGRGGFYKEGWSIPAIPWFSLGFRYFHNINKEDQVYVPYIEFGFWFYVNIGVGYSHLYGEKIEVPASLHLFIGLPLPLVLSNSLFFEPYYRPIIVDKVHHEFGIMIKHGF